MADEVQLSSDSVPTDPTVNPGDETKPTNEWQTRAEKAEGDLGKVRDFYSNYPEATQFLRSYVDNSELQTQVKHYLEKGAFSVAPETTESTPAAFEGLDEDTKKAVSSYISQQLEEKSKPIQDQMTQVRQQQMKTQLDEWRSSYTTERGWPVAFKDVENQISEMLNRGEAVSAQGAFKQIAADAMLKNKSKTDQELQKLKIQASLSGGGVPTTMHVRQKGERKSIQQAFEEALSELEPRS